MRILLLLLTLISLCIQPLSISVMAEEIPEYWQDACEDWAQALISPIAVGFDYASACQVYRQCEGEHEIGLICPLYAADALLADCTTDDLDCRRQALLLTAMIQGIDRSGLDVFNQTISPQDLVNRILNGLESFFAGDFEQALADFDFSPEVYLNPMMPFARGIVYDQLGDDESALTAYAQSLAIMPSDPLVRYMRIPLYGRLGQAQFASFDAYWLGEFTAQSPQLHALTAPLTEAYPLDVSQVETLNFYPLISLHAGVAADVYQDETGVERIPVHVLEAEDGNGMFVLGLFGALGMDESVYLIEGAVDAYFLPQHALDPNRYSFSRSIGTYEFESSYSLELVITPDAQTGMPLYEGSSINTYFESYQEQRFIMTVSESDPRIRLRENICGVVSRLEVGIAVQPSVRVQPLVFYDQPNGDISEPSGTRLTVQGDGTCVADILWWQVATDTGDTAWLPENDQAIYLLNPVDEERLWFGL